MQLFLEAAFLFIYGMLLGLTAAVLTLQPALALLAAATGNRKE